MTREQDARAHELAEVYASVCVHEGAGEVVAECYRRHPEEGGLVVNRLTLWPAGTVSTSMGAVFEPHEPIARRDDACRHCSSGCGLCDGTGTEGG